MFRFMREETPDEWGIKKLQDKILEIAVYLDELCRENGIEYCLMGGSALGALRHGGFIPWDDDLDFFMTPDNYEKFVRVFEEKGDKERFFLEPFGAFDNMVTIGKVRAKNTTYIESALTDYRVSHNVFVDIFILHTCPNNALRRRHQYMWAKYVIAKSQSARDFSGKSFPMRCALRLLRCLPRLFLVKHALKQVYKYRGEKTDFYCNFLGKARYRGGIYKREWFEKQKSVPFETVNLNVPEGIEPFLRERFGDYMKIPSLDRIRYEQHAMVWDTEKDYKEYLEKEPTYPLKYIF